MTYREIFKEICRNNKRYIMLIITLCMVCSMLAFGGTPQACAEEMSSAELSSRLGGSFGALIAPVLAAGFFGGIDTSWTMVIMSMTSILSSLGREVGIAQLGVLQNFSYGIFENQQCAWILLIWFGLPLLMKLSGKTEVMGIAMENMKKLNGVVVTIVIISQMIATVGTKDVVKAAGIHNDTLSSGITVLMCFVLLMIAMTIYFLVRYMFEFIDIIMLPVCTIVPGMSFVMVIAKFVWMWILLLVAKYIPALFYGIMGITVIIATLVFRTAYMALKYFENIYAKPLFRRIFKGFDPQISLIDPKMPRAMKEFISDKNVILAIPAYVLIPFPNVKGIHKWERWYLVSEGAQPYLVKCGFFSKECTSIPIVNVQEQKMFINQFLTYFELFNIYGSEETIVKSFKRVPKYSHIVFSREYSHRYPEIVNITGFVDYKQYKEYLTNVANGRMPYVQQ